MVGYSAEQGVCDMYRESLSAASLFTFQDSTKFYKPFSTCEQDGYSYIGDQNVCMKISSTVASFNDARSSCQSEGGDLIIVKTEDLSEYLGEILESDKHYWIGATQTPRDLSNWFWVDGSPVDLGIWSPGEPNGLAEECMESMYPAAGDLRVNDAPCGDPKYYVCQKPTN